MSIGDASDPFRMLEKLSQDQAGFVEDVDRRLEEQRSDENLALVRRRYRVGIDREHLQMQSFRYKGRLISLVPWFAAVMCGLSFIIPFIMLWLVVYNPAIANGNLFYMISFNVPLFGIAGTLMALFLRATNT